MDDVMPLLEQLGVTVIDEHPYEIAAPDGTIVSANPAAFRILGEDRLEGKKFDLLLLVSGSTDVQTTEGHRVRRAWFPRDDRMGVLEIISTKLGDRGSSQTVGIVTDTGLFLHQLAETLNAGD